MIKKTYTVELSDASILEVYADNDCICIGFLRDKEKTGDVLLNREEIKEFQKSVRLATREINKKKASSDD